MYSPLAIRGAATLAKLSIISKNSPKGPPGLANRYDLVTSDTRNATGGKSASLVAPGNVKYKNGLFSLQCLEYPIRYLA